MDPNLFHLDWERVFEALVAVIVLSFLLERALAPLFESKPFIVRLDKPGVKELIAAAVSITGCIWWQFDVVSMIILTERTTIPGAVVTGAVIAGGSKASIKLFHDVLDIKSSTYARRHEVIATAAADDAIAAAVKVRAMEGESTLSALSDAEAKIERNVKKAEAAAARAPTKLAERAVESARKALKDVQSCKNPANDSKCEPNC